MQRVTSAEILGQHAAIAPEAALPVEPSPDDEADAAFVQGLKDARGEG